MPLRIVLSLIFIAVLAIGFAGTVALTGRFHQVEEPSASATTEAPAVRPKPERPDFSQIRPVLRVGDVILLGGSSIWLQAGVSLSRQRPAYGHVGIVVTIDPEIRILEATGSPVDDGKVAKSELSHFIRDAEWLTVMRPRHHAEELAVSALAAADIATGFDSDFDLASPDKLYCTELIDVAMTADIWGTPLERLMLLEKPVILPEAILVHSDFDQVLVLPERIDPLAAGE